MINAFLNLKLRVKLLLAFGSLLILSVLSVLIFFRTLKEINYYQYASEEVDAVNIHVLEMDAAIKYFMLEGYKHDDFQKDHNSKYILAYTEALHQINDKINFLTNSRINRGDSLTTAISRSLQKIDKQVNTLADNFTTRGFKDYGLEGKLREAIHEVEKSPFRYDKADMLTLRRHEKDFFLRKDLKYQDEFNRKIEQFISAIQLAPENEDRNAILQNMDNYKNQFNQVVAIDTEIGLKDTDGIKGGISHSLLSLNASIAQLRTFIKNESNAFKRKATLALIMLFFIQMVLGIVLAIVYANIITRAIKELLRAMQSLAEGVSPSPLIIKSNEEIGKTKIAFNQLLERLTASTKFSESLGQGNLTAIYDERFTNDILALSLIKMQQQLMDSHQKQNVVNWTNSGIAKLNDILKNEGEDVAKLGDQIVSELVQYTNANQGALYLLEQQEGEQYLQRIATYAYGKKKVSEQRIDIGHGLVGQCIQEMSTVLITNVPHNFIKITSGLGEATPRCVIIVPLIIHGRAMGALELASFDKLEPYKIQFLEKIAESLASILSNKKVNAETSRLLAEAHQRAEQLLAQEEEIRQNAEEMQAVQEQMQRQHTELEREITLLRGSTSLKVTLSQN